MVDQSTYVVSHLDLRASRLHEQGRGAPMVLREIGTREQGAPGRTTSSHGAKPKDDTIVGSYGSDCEGSRRNGEGGWDQTMMLRLRRILTQWKARRKDQHEEKRESVRQEVRAALQPIVDQLDEDELRRQAVMNEIRIVRRQLEFRRTH